jgi:hypothetical protein
MKIFDNQAQELLDISPHLQYYSKREDFRFSMLRKVPEVLIKIDSPKAKFCFDRGIDYFDHILFKNINT